MPTSKKATTTKYRLYKATGQAVVTIAGVDRYLGKHGSAVSKKEYRREWHLRIPNLFRALAFGSFHGVRGGACMFSVCV